MSKCNARFIKTISASEKMIYDPDDVRISVSSVMSDRGSVPPGSATDLITCSRHYDILAKLVVERRRLSRFPAKMMLVHSRALLSTEKISYS